MTAHERKGLGLRIGEIARRVHEALGEPDATQGCFQRLPAPEEVHTARGREEELSDRAPEHVEGPTHE